MNQRLQEVIQELFSYYEDFEVPNYYEDNEVSIDRNSIIYMYDKDDDGRKILY